MKNKILLVDDEEGIRKVLGISLADSGYDVLTAENGDEALRIFRNEHPDIILSDIKMPGMDGIELLKQIKQESPDTEVILITGHGDMELAIKSLKHEATDFITKPINDDDLEKALQKSRDKLILRQQLREYTENLESLVQQKSEKLRKIENLATEAETQVFDEMPCHITVHSRDFKLMAANRLFRETFDFDAGALCHKVFKDSDQPCQECPVTKTFEDGQSHHSEMLLTPKQGKPISVLALTSPMKDASGTVNRVLTMFTDISELADMQDHLSSLGLMVSSVSHSIKGLLTGLDGGVYLLSSGFSKEKPEQIGEGLEIVKLMVGRIRNMVLDILYYAKERDLKMETVKLRAFAEEVADVIAAKAKEQSLELTRRIDPDLKTFCMDADQIHSALVNILENAVDACVEDRSKPSHQIIFSVGQDDTHFIFDIQDNGTGMSEETREQIFTLFFSSKATRGTGIGLFVSKKIIHQHGGTIDVTSEPGKGTHFCIKLPKNVGKGSVLSGSY